MSDEFDITPEERERIEEESKWTKENREKKDLVSFSGLARTESGKLTKSNYFRFLNHDLDDYSDMTFTPEQAKKISTHLLKLSTGSTAMTPMYCGGDLCQPEGTLIKTSNRGEVPIEQLTPDDKVWTWERRVDSLRKRGKAQELFSREYSGWMYSIRTGKRNTHTTPEHKMIAKWDESAVDKFCVYLMQKGDQFRIGKTKLLVQDKGRYRFGPASRARAEKAHAIWILGVYATNTEALLAEETFSINWQIPKALFLATVHKEEIKYNGLYRWISQERLDQHHAQFQYQEPRIKDLLKQNGLSIEVPFWVSDQARCCCSKKQKFGKNSTFEIAACNILSGFMRIPVVEDSSLERTYNGRYAPVWTRATTDMYMYNGLVYSMEVDDHHTYIADGIVTHNCPFKERCPLWQIGKAPVGKQCLIEVELMKTWIVDYMEEFDVDPNNFTEVAYVNELAELMVLEMRLNMNLAKAENAELITDQTMGVDREGDPIIQKVLSPFMDAKERIGNRRSKIIKLMVGDRQEKYKKEAALKIKLEKDPSSQMSSVRNKLEGLSRQLNTMENKAQEDREDIRQEDDLSPEDLINIPE